MIFDIHKSTIHGPVDETHNTQPELFRFVIGSRW